jgi:hypothetical protein
MYPIKFQKFLFKFLKCQSYFTKSFTISKNFDTLGDIFRLKIGFENLLFCRMLDFTTCASKESKNYTKSYIQTKDLAKYVEKDC